MKKIYVVVTGLIGIATASQASAVLLDRPKAPGGSNLFVSFASNDPGSVVLSVTSILLSVASAIALLYLIIGGFYYVTAGLSEELASKGKSYIKNSIIGLIIIILSYTIISVIYQTFWSA